MNCDQCEAMRINGVFCHEHGCPNQRKVWNVELGDWVDEPQDPVGFEDGFCENY